MPITFATLLLASPVWHLSLQPPTLGVPQLVPDLAMQLAPGAPDPETLDDEEVAAQLRQRRDIALVHRAFGIATLVAMATTAVLGFIQFGDEYGFHGTRTETACVQGTAVMQDFCGSTPPWPHAIAAGTTAVLYFTTLGLALSMPDPLHVESGSSGWSERVRIHDALHWVHLSGIIVQALLGAFLANATAFGLNLDHDFTTMQALAGVHMAVGVVTFAALATAAAVVTF
jgi:hypothetical protein